MKKLLILFILISLVLLIPAYAFGAIHNFGDNYAETDNWFTITPDQPYMEAHYRSTGNSIPLTSLGFEYFLNDQTFVDFNCYKQDQGNWTYLTGSYLTGFGLFAGLELYSYTYPGYSFQRLMVSPGYRLAIDEQSYVTLSLDYYSNKSLQDIIDWEVNARYYNDKMKVFGDIISYTKPSYGTSNFNVGINYQVTKSIVVGGSLLAKEAGKDIMMGATYNSERFIIDGQIYTYNPSAEASSNQINLSGMFLLGNNFKAGLQVMKSSMIDDPALTLKAKMTMENSSFILKLTPKNDSFNSSMSLSYERRL